MTPAEKTKKWRQDNPEKARAGPMRLYYANLPRERMSRRNSGFRRLYGITVAQRDDMITEQDGLCAVCDGTFFSVPHIDHDHSTKKVRGILCSGCNQALGNIHESIPTLRSLIAYLEKHDEQRTTS